MRHSVVGRWLLPIACVLVLAGWMPALTGSVPAARAQGPEWRSLPSPGSLYGAAAIIDAPRDRLVLHEGETSEWAPPAAPSQLDLRGLQWSEWQVQGTRPVSSRSGRGALCGATVLDSVDGVILSLCECTGSEAYEMNLASDTWTEVLGLDRDRVPSNLVYDPIGDRAIGFGGREYGFMTILTRTVAYDLSPSRTGWSALPPTPFQLLDQAVAVDPDQGRAYVFGGQGPTGAVVDQLWCLDLGSADQPGAWSLVEAVGPSARMGASLTYIGDHRLILFGGYAEGVYSDEVWLLDTAGADGPAWARLVTGGPGPQARAVHAAAWDFAAERLIVIGGTSGGELSTFVLDDAWLLDWSPEPTPTPDPAVSATPAETPEATVFLPISHRG